MKNKKFIIGLLMTAFLLGGCKDKNPSSSDGSASSVDETVYTALEEYEKHSGWPGTAISDFLAEYDVTSVVPALSVSGSTYTYLAEEFDAEPYIELFLPGTDRSDAYVTVLENAGWEVVEAEDQAGYFMADSATASDIFIDFYFEAEGYGYPDGLSIFIGVYADDNGNGGGDGDGNGGGTIDPDDFYSYYDEHTGWPGAALSSFLADHSITSSFPSISVSGKSYTYFELGDEQYYPYFEIFIPTTNHISAFKTALTSGGYSVEEADGWVDAEHPTLGIWIEATYAQDEDTYPDGTVIYINVDDEMHPYIGSGDGGNGGNNGGGTVVNPDNGFAYDFATEAQLTTKDTSKSVWTSDTSTMSVEENGAAQNVGNTAAGASYYSNPLRVYSGQKVTFDAGADKTIAQVVITVQEYISGSDTRNHAGLIGGTYDPAANATASGLVVTITPGTSAQTLSVVLTQQTRFVSLVIYYN